ncbi:hypothetical protein [Telmatospirillum sp. J64-1]|uniref:hypothetical protein n=1 Tax=Telmatospirillum sp. J64-1 TaxID=2502183 RepID=UPI00115E703B|nr:hypothetical protein [Telmatospirillum sp. J64-1]
MEGDLNTRSNAAAADQDHEHKQVLLGLTRAIAKVAGEAADANGRPGLAMEATLSAFVSIAMQSGKQALAISMMSAALDILEIDNMDLLAQSPAGRA